MNVKQVKNLMTKRHYVYVYATLEYVRICFSFYQYLPIIETLQTV